MRARLIPLRKGRSRGQAMVEFALVLPLMLLTLSLSIDFARLLFTYSAISAVAVDGSRMLALRPQRGSDCLALGRMLGNAQGYNLDVDPKSVDGNASPSTPSATTAPPLGSGYVYIYPAVSTTAPQYPSNCTGTQRTGNSVTVQITYTFVPLTPVVSKIAPNITITTVSSIPLE